MRYELLTNNLFKMVKAQQNQNTNLTDLKLESNENSFAKNIVTVLSKMMKEMTPVILEKANIIIMENTKNSL